MSTPASGTSCGTTARCAPGATPVEAPAGARAAPFPDARKERPMLATLVAVAFGAPGWLWEPKLDGVRMLAFIRDGKAELRSRRGVDVTKQYPSLVASLAAQPAATMVLDGEVCALDEAGVPRFQLLQPRINLTRGVDAAKVDAELPVVFFVFDLLYLDGYDLRAVPLRERKALLQSRLLPKENLRVVGHVEEHGGDVEAGGRRSASACATTSTRSRCAARSLARQHGSRQRM